MHLACDQRSFAQGRLDVYVTEAATAPTYGPTRGPLTVANVTLRGRATAVNYGWMPTPQ